MHSRVVFHFKRGLFIVCSSLVRAELSTTMDSLAMEEERKKAMEEEVKSMAERERLECKAREHAAQLAK